MTSHLRKASRALARACRPWPYLLQGQRRGNGLRVYSLGAGVLLSGMAALWHWLVVWPTVACCYLYWVTFLLTVWLAVWLVSAAIDLLSYLRRQRAVREVSGKYGSCKSGRCSHVSGDED